MATSTASSTDTSNAAAAAKHPVPVCFSADANTELRSSLHAASLGSRLHHRLRRLAP